MKKTNNSPAISLNALVPKRTKNYTLSIEPRILESSSVIYGMEKDSIAYLSDYIKNHPRMKDAEMHRLACKYFYLKQQYVLLKERLDNVDEKLTQPNDAITTCLLEAEKEELSYLLELIPYKAVFSELEETLVAHNLRLILKIANGYSGKGMCVDDLIQEGVFGFMYAIDRYDPNKNVKLGTYATGATNNKGEGQYNVAFTYGDFPKTKTNGVTERGIITYPRSTEDVDDHFKRISDAVAKFSPTQFKEMTNWRNHVNQANSERIPNYRRGTITISSGGKNFVFDPKTQDFFEGQEEY
jgi:RNA polymerase sigma factor (sigma-70 family)